MIQYQDGSEIRVGDAVLIENGKTAATVVEVVTTLAQQRDSAVDVPGVMLRSAPFGLLYLPGEFLTEHPLQFVSRS